MGKLLVFLSVLVLYFVQESHSHGRFVKPPNRSSIWRDPAFASQNPPANYNDNELYCGAVHQAENPGSNCGVCGDPLSSPAPRANEVGGQWYRGIITGNYQSGQVIDVEDYLSAAHLGFMEWRLCTDHNQESQQCFNQNSLQRADGSGSRLPVLNGPGTYTTQLRLPAGVRCEHCVIQWNYRAGNTWGECEDGTSANGCGPQETFRGCSDVKIS